jgi:hypothetical protein
MCVCVRVSMKASKRGHTQTLAFLRSSARSTTTGNAVDDARGMIVALLKYYYLRNSLLDSSCSET